MQLLHVLKDSKVSKFHALLYASHPFSEQIMFYKNGVCQVRILGPLLLYDDIAYRVQHLMIFMLGHIIQLSLSTMRQQ